MSAALRIQHHQAGTDLMRSGDYFQALTILQNAFFNYGPHVGLLSDLVAVLFLMGRIEDCKTMTSRLEAELESAQSLLSTESQAKTHLFLGKMNEEQALPHRALLNYQKAVALSSEHTEVRVRSQAQLLRLNSFLGLRGGLPQLYQTCLSLKTPSMNLMIELEHALLLAELTLFGPTLAEARLRQLLESASLSPTDQILVLVDFAEEMLRQNLPLEGLLDMISNVDSSGADEFEKIILEMAQAPTAFLESSHFHQSAKNLSLMGTLRVLILNIRRAPSKDLADSFRKLLVFHLDGVEFESRSLLLKKWNTHLSSAEVLLEYDILAGVLRCKDQQVSVRAKSFADNCLQCFIHSKHVAIEELIQKAFASELDSSYYDRTRIALQRLNKELSVLTGTPKVFTLKKTHVELQTGLEIRSRKG